MSGSVDNWIDGCLPISVIHHFASRPTAELRNMDTTPFYKMGPATQTTSRKPFYVWLAIVGVPIWAATFLILMWRHLGGGVNARGVIGIFGVASTICVALILTYLLLPHRRGPYARHVVGAAVGGLVAMSLTVPVFVPLIQIQINLTMKIMLAIKLPLLIKWSAIMAPYSYCIEIVVIGMAAGWIFVVVTSKLKVKRTGMGAW
jgi:hypothetical protein